MRGCEVDDCEVGFAEVVWGCELEVGYGGG